KVGVIDDSALLAGVTSQLGEWIASRSGEVSIHEQPVRAGSLGDVDVVLFPGDRLGDLIDAGALAPISNEAVMPPVVEGSEEGGGGPDRVDGERDGEDSFAFLDVAPAYRDQVSRYGSDRVALPCGGSALVLAYRRDAFERESNRTAAGPGGLKLEPPATWKELDALAPFLPGRGWERDGPSRH